MCITLKKQGPFSALVVLLCVPGIAQEAFSAREVFLSGLEIAAASASATANNPKRPNPPATVQTRKNRSTTPPVPSVPARNPVISGSGPVSVAAIPAAYAHLGLRYAILQMNGSQEVEVAPSTTFRSGDRIRLDVQVNSDGYLYIATQGSSGAWQVLFPSESDNNGSNHLKAGEHLKRKLAFVGKPGTEMLFIMMSRAPERDVDSIIYFLKNGQTDPSPGPSNTVMQLASNAEISNKLVSGLRELYSRDIILEETGKDVTVEKATYIVNKTSTLEPRLVADIKLTHE